MGVQAPLGDGVGDAFLEHLLSNFGEQRGFELALKWLYSLFVSEASQGGRKPSPDAGTKRTTQESLEGAFASLCSLLLWERNCRVPISGFPLLVGS
jgi:hypothetical protein